MKNKLFLLFFLFAYFIYAQNVRHITVEDGLPQSFVSGILQDDQDFIWIGTRNGLSRFDGYEFKIFQHGPKEEYSLTSNLIGRIELGKNNMLFIEYDSGEIDVLNVLNGTVKHLIDKEFIHKEHIPETKVWTITSDTVFWYFSEYDKLNSINLKDGVHKNQTYFFRKDSIRAFLQGNKETLWVLTQNYLKSFDETTNTFDSVPLPFKMDFNDKVYFGYDTPQMFQRENGLIIWGDRQFIFEYNPSKNQFKKHRLPEKSFRSHINASMSKLGIVYFINKNKVYIFDNKIEEKYTLPSFHEKGIKDFLVDESGLLWFSIDTDGIYQVDFHLDFQTLNYKKTFLFDLLKEKYGLRNEELTPFFEGDFSLPPSYYLRSQLQGSTNWIALNRSVLSCNFNKKNHKLLPKIPQVNERDFTPIKGITLLAKNVPLVINSQGELWVYSLEENKWDDSLKNAFINHFDENIQPNDIYYDGNLLWIISKSKGLYVMDLKTVEVKKIAKKDLPVLDLLEITPDKFNKDILWIGSYNGLIKFNKKTFKSEIYSIKNGLPDNTIYAILVAENGDLWLSTNHGLCRFNTKDKYIKSYNLQHGIPILEYNRYHKLYLPNGELAFGGTEKGVIFTPSTFILDNYQPKTAIIDLKINNLSTVGTIEDNAIDSLNLIYKKNSLIVQYAALQYNQPSDINYRYRLLGYDQNNNWQVVNGRRQAIYTKIPPGKYTFEVNSSNISGKWSNYVKRLEVEVSPPWWDTWWAWILYGAIFMIIIIVFIQYQVKQKIYLKEIELKEVEAKKLRELDEIKTNFFSNITHEIRTPLSLILGPAEYMEDHVKNKDYRHYLKIIIQNTKRLLVLTDQLLDFSKAQAGALRPIYTEGNIGQVIKECIEAFEEELKVKNIQLDYSNNLTSDYSFSKEFLERILFNLISNAIKYNKDNGLIYITLEEFSEDIKLVIKDTGKGISKEHLDEIFNRYYREENSDKTAKGSGIGLSLVKELVKLQGGTISVGSQTGNRSGTTFTLLFPYHKIGKKGEREPSKPEQIFQTGKKLSKVLLVEDNIELRDFIHQSLQDTYEVTIANNGKEGYKIAKEALPDIIVSDVMMDKMDGLELCKALKANSITTHIPVILLTAKADMSNKLEGLSIGADEYIYKPFSIKELSLRIQNLLQLKKRLKEHVYQRMSIPIPEYEEGTIEDPFVNKVNQIIVEKLADERFNVEQLAEAMNMSRASLHRKIKAVTNMSAGQIIKIYRLKKSLRLLKQNYNIAEVAYKTGFGSPSYFSKCFKEVYHITPTQFIENQTEF